MALAQFLIDRFGLFLPFTFPLTDSQREREGEEKRRREEVKKTNYHQQVRSGEKRGEEGQTIPIQTNGGSALSLVS